MNSPYSSPFDAEKMVVLNKAVIDSDGSECAVRIGFAVVASIILKVGRSYKFDSLNTKLLYDHFKSSPCNISVIMAEWRLIRITVESIFSSAFTRLTNRWIERRN